MTTRRNAGHFQNGSVACLVSLLILGLALFLFPITSRAQKALNPAPADSTWIHIFRMSLSEEFSYRGNPSYKGDIGPKDVLILDSNIVKDDFPPIPKGMLVPISIGKIDSLVRQGNEIDYIFLASLRVDSGVARVKWDWMTAAFSRRHRNVFHLRRRSDEGSYRLTKNGWVGGITRTVNYGLKRPG